MLNLLARTHRILPGVHLTVVHRILTSGSGRDLGSQLYYGRITFGPRPTTHTELKIASRIATRINRREIH